MDQATNQFPQATISVPDQLKFGGKVFASCLSKSLDMKKNALVYGSLLLFVSLLASCSVIGGIFKAGVWVGILIVLAIIGLIIWLIGRGRG